jgi:ABC-type transport system involved in cytochrome c biogenesis ATPase subunit
MGELLLDSLKIENFRCFDHLEIKKLGRVNLIIGDNGIGKTALLEALWLYYRKASIPVIWYILGERDENIFTNIENEVQLSDDISRKVSLLHLFNGYEKILQRNGYSPTISIGNIANPSKTLTVSIDWNGIRGGKDVYGVDFLMPRLPVKFGGENVNEISSADFVEIKVRQDAAYIPVSGFNKQLVARLWDNIVLDKKTDEVISILQLFNAEISEVNLLGNERIPVASLKSENKLQPLRKLGSGITRAFQLALALVNSKKGLILIDEIENGIHYELLPKLWDLIIKTAKAQNVQVFATTHSKDCLDAFINTSLNEKEEAVLIRLEKRRGRLIAVDFDREGLEVIADTTVEVR